MINSGKIGRHLFHLQEAKNLWSSQSIIINHASIHNNNKDYFHCCFSSIQQPRAEVEIYVLMCTHQLLFMVKCRIEKHNFDKKNMRHANSVH